MTRARFRAAAAICVSLLLAGLGWLLFAPSPATNPEVGPERTASRAPRETGEEAEARTAASGRQASGDAGTGPPEPGKENLRPEEEPTIPGLCVLEDGTPLAGVEIRVTQAWNETSESWGTSRSTVAGTFEAYPDRRIRVQHPSARVTSVEGAVLLEPGWEALLRSDVGAQSIRIVFRDEPGTAHVRLVDSSTMEPVATVKGLRLTYHFGHNLSGRAVYEHSEDTGLGGWIPIREGALPEDLDIDADPAGVVVEFAASGYAPKRVPLPDIRGRMTVRVDPIPACATGHVYVPTTLDSGPPGQGWSVTASFRAQDGSPPADASGVRGLPSGFGPFRIDDLPQGAWTLEVTALRESTVRRARKSFEYRGSTVDLGGLTFESGATVRSRAVDAAGEPVPQARVVVVREGEDPEKARLLAPADDGWVAYADLEPNSSHRAVALGMPRALEKPVQTSPDGKPVEVELSWPEKLVPCRITLVVDGKAVANPDGTRTIPATVHESPVPREVGAWHPDGTFSTKLVPGTYRFSAYATPEGGGDLALFGAEVTVPPGDSFETRLELIRESR